MANVFFPSCKARAAYKEPSQKLAEYIKYKFDIDSMGCCKINNSKLNNDDTAIILCLNCARVIEANAKYKSIKFVWEIIDQDRDFIFPDYHGQKMLLQDCHVGRGRKNVQNSIRSLMKKMNIEILELEKNYDNAEHCASHEIIGYHREQPMTKEEQEEYFKYRYKNTITDIVVSYCKYCNDGVSMSGKKGLHILELLFPNN
ncbi:hypothetical protein [Clostridium intestinale]|uniref:Uncharacterized protein n=1 Tax=Clostridium intestinale TaxID=36845 RepID=A0A7D6VSS3_9CLOT|nr:hypothetical protein [Clostridium intestinale]QLY78192.1 hypothetical protein HZF06_13960 [Clostridium intestinale]